MADNTSFHASLDPAMPKIADKEVTHAGDQAKVQLIALVEVTGTEGAYTLREMAGLDTLLTAVRDRLPAALVATGLKTASSDQALTANIAIATSTTVSSVVDTAGCRNLGLLVGSTFDGTQIQFLVSYDNSSFYPLYDIFNTRVIMTVAASRAYDLPGELVPWRYIKIETLTVQATTDTPFVFVTRT